MKYYSLDIFGCLQGVISESISFCITGNIFFLYKEKSFLSLREVRNMSGSYLKTLSTGEAKLNDMT